MFILLTLLSFKQIGYYKKNGEYYPLYIQDDFHHKRSEYHPKDDSKSHDYYVGINIKNEKPLFTKIKSTDPLTGRVTMATPKHFYLSDIQAERKVRTANLDGIPVVQPNAHFIKRKIERNYQSETNQNTPAMTFQKSVITRTYPSVNEKPVLFKKSMIERKYQTHTEAKENYQNELLLNTIEKKSADFPKDEKHEKPVLQKAIIGREHNDTKNTQQLFQKRVIKREFPKDNQNDLSQKYTKSVISRNYPVSNENTKTVFKKTVIARQYV
ncbi:hypothetical protein TRFO_22773 [Tritrichomonas foetus]|uniref:Uncharacterized protein n=1 Tax=Tritrichomonas foetus TaxID=1144522 RepID=A0A1J4KC90_9EUKA|nr:hypothetical protein TRFO_22773 [Tritrichomonas foetus]|eukprot:OHT08594.1 hypothetical protein TRFO_22773 [Tritrichomonas foetus]